MDAKDLRTESAVSERNNDGSKYSQSGGLALHCDRNKSYQDIGSNSLGKVDVPNARPCAVIGPDRVVPPAANEGYLLKKGPSEPWSCMDNTYRRPPEYPHKLSNFQNPTRNISPRQTFQENMQRIMVPPTYNSIKINDDNNYTQISDRNNGLSKNIKMNVPQEAKFCDVPYAVNPNPNNEQKNIRNPEMCISSVNPNVTRTASHGWPHGSVNLRSTRMYGTPELYQYQEYPSCAGPRPVVPRPHRTVPEDQGYVYADPYYQDGNIRFKPYPTIKERYPQQRYEYIGNYPNPFHPPPSFPSHKYEIQKSMPSHPYPPYPIKYLDSRVSEPVMEGYQRTPQGNYNIQYRNQVIHPNYGPVLGNCPQNKMHSYPSDAHIKSIAPNKLPYDTNTKAYIEYDNTRPKMYPTSESYFVNEMTRMPMKSQVIMPNYPSINMHNIPPNQYYKKDNQQIKNYEHMAHFRNMDHNLNIHNPMSRHPPVFSPNTLAISPTDSSTSNDTQTLGTSQEDCGYVSQSSTASVRSMDSGVNRISNDCLRRYYDNRYGPIVRSTMMSKSQLNAHNNVSKEKKDIDVRQFLQMWKEGDDEAEENSSKEVIIQTGGSEKHNFGKSHEAMNNQEQLYVLGLVNVPSEELAKYEHIQKVSKLPENIKGYNSIELLNQFEEVIESTNMNNYKSPTPKEYQMSMKGLVPKQITGVMPQRPVSPLDVEAKISQSVIHKEVGCNFEIKPCSPKMLNVEVAAPVQNMLAERVIEKVTNPVMIKSPMISGLDENINCNIMKRQDHRLTITENVRIPSCKMINTQFPNNNIDSIKNSYSLQDLESNSGLCLASLPRLDNDIELNFPEVNQQFINANKGDSTSLSNSLKDLPTLEVLDQSNNQTKDKFDSSISLAQENECKNVIKSPYVVESEKEFSKLSKYRKTKTISTELKENQTQHNVNAVRTDSVIIKNPENKNYEEISDFSTNSLNKSISEIQQAPINLTSQGNLLDHTESEPLNIKPHDTDIDKQLPIEIAIDFSLNKSGIIDTVCTKTKNELDIETPKILENPSELRENGETKLIGEDTRRNSALPDFCDSNDESLETHHITETCSLNCENNCEGTTKQNTENDNNTGKMDLHESPPHNETCVETMITANECASDIDGVSIETTVMDICSESLLSRNSEISPIELLSEVNNENGKTAMEFNECNDIKNYEFSNKIKYCFTETYSDIPQKTEKDETHVEDSAKNISTIKTTEDDFCDNQNNLSCSDTTDIKHVANELELVPIEVEDPDQNDSVVTKQIEPQNTERNLHLNNKEFFDGDNRTNSLQFPNDTNIDPQSFSSDFMIDKINDNTDDHNTTHLLEFPDPNESIQNLEVKFCENTTHIESTPQPESQETFNKYPTPSPNNSIAEKCETTVKQKSWYSSKEIYSPWIQKLLMFSEGNISNPTTKIDMKHDEDSNTDTTEVVPEETLNNEEVSKSESDMINDQKITDTNDYAASYDIITNSVDQVDNINDYEEDTIHTEGDKIPQSTTNQINNYENETTDAYVDYDTNSTKLEETNDMNESIIESEPPKNELNNMDLNTPAGSPLFDDGITNNTEQQCEQPNTYLNPEDASPCEETDEMTEDCEVKTSAPESSTVFENFQCSLNKTHTSELPYKRRHPLKRSLSDSALNMYKNDEHSKQENEDVQFILPLKRRKLANVNNDLLAQNLCNIIHNNRRNSISSFYNEDNVSFCILIDNSCIITEEENEEQEKVCYTELTEDCITEIQNDCITQVEDTDALTETMSSPTEQNVCDYSDTFVTECEEEKTLEESWVEDVGCVETVIGDDIAEDIEISGPSSPKDDVLSDNDESGVFSSCEHTDKVKYIYGDKMCSDDAQFVDTLYKTPQMDVNKTLFNRETLVSEEYDRYYDNDSLEKMLSESNEQDLSPYVPEYMHAIFPSDGGNSKETPEDKENLNIDTFSSFQDKDNNLEIVVGINVDSIEHNNLQSMDFFSKTQVDTVHSCESSIDNVFTYKQKDDDTIYTTSNSPEVSSTTSEEKSSSILLKITNYKGSRVSQINDISRVNKRPSCKFTEDKDYLQSHGNFSSNRPLLTKAAQKYIPPLKESIRDLKVKLSLPQHSLIKLKQLKISKDEPKFKKHNTISRIPKKPKPKFEDVLKSIDEIQFKMHKEKTKKAKKSIPKVVIKKSQNGSHYASTSNKDDFNPDLTGRKWQPWVFIEKNYFIDKMAIKNKTKAIYSHRKKTYVLAEKFQKYKSVSSAKFVISPPISDSPSSGLKYTIRLKHNY